MMDFFVPEGLLESLPNFGEEGTRWLERLPGRVAELEREWGIAVGRAFPTGGCVSWVAPVELEDGTPAVLKIGVPHDEARFEAEALRFWDGRGAARLLKASDDGFTLLLERCDPGTDLWSLDVDEADAVGAEALRQLWREPDPHAPFISLTDFVAEWGEWLPREAPSKGYDPDLIAHAVELGRDLTMSQSRRVLLHGDFHPSNVLAAHREPWLVIDPKPLVGDPAYDLAQWLANRYDAAILTDDPVSTFRTQIDRFAERLELDPARIAGWTFVKSLGWDWGPEAASLFLRVAEAG